MTCSSRQAALTELAATGAEPTSELRAHLHQCPSCRTTLERERRLFASIDAGLRASSQVVVPPSLLPRVRARMAERRTFGLAPGRFRTVAFAIAAPVALALSINTFRRPAHSKNPSSPPSQQSSPSLARTATIASQQEPAAFKQNKKPDHRPGVPQPLRTGKAGPEVMVPADQEILLAHYADQLSRRHSARALVAAQSKSVEPQPLEVDLIQIAQLDVQPLEEQTE